jgi:hypothetical protein
MLAPQPACWYYIIAVKKQIPFWGKDKNSHE